MREICVAGVKSETDQTEHHRVHYPLLPRLEEVNGCDEFVFPVEGFCEVDG